LGRFYLK
jgi:hypothetical protein